MMSKLISLFHSDSSHFKWLVIVVGIGCTSLSQAQNSVNKNTSNARQPSGLSDSQKSLEIRGQSRNLSMLLVLKNQNENIDFVKPRNSYKSEIQKTGF